VAHYLQSVLEINDPLFTIGLNSLEKSTGNSGVDTRLIADILEKSHKIMRKLGLDTKNTTVYELYNSLSATIKKEEIESMLFDFDYVLYNIDSQIISFNLIDIIENSHHELPFERRIISHGQRSLRGELIGRYINHARTDESTVLDLALSISLLSKHDAWYNNFNHKQNKTDKHLKELEE